jgi:hypothetical protein
MEFWLILKVIAAAITAGFGVWGLVDPVSAARFGGVSATEKRGLGELRAIYGGVVFALAAYALITRVPPTFTMLGLAYLAAGVARMVSIHRDAAGGRRVWQTAWAEIGLGVILVV